MIETSKEFQPIPLADPSVAALWDAFMGRDGQLSVEAARRRNWSVLPVSEAVIADMHDWLLAALESRAVSHLLVYLCNSATPSKPAQVGELRVGEGGLRLLQDAALTYSYLITDRKQQFCCFQAYTDLYLLAGDVNFIEEVQRCSFQTSLEMSLDLASAFGESEAKPGWFFKTCQRYSGCFPAGARCEAPSVSQKGLKDSLNYTDASLLESIAALIEVEENRRVFSHYGLKSRGWQSVALVPPPSENVFDWACDAEWLAKAISCEGVAELEMFEFSGDARHVPVTRDGLLAFASFMHDTDVVLTDLSGSLAILGSAQDAIFVAGSAEFIERVSRSCRGQRA